MSSPSVEPAADPVPQPPPLLDPLRPRAIEYGHPEAMADCYILFHHKRPPRPMSAAEIESFPTDLAVEGKVAASMQNQASSALLFLYQKVLGIEVPWMDSLARPVPHKRIPVVLTRAEVDAVLGKLVGQAKVIGALLYGCGLRLMEGLRLRIKDVDFDRHVIVVQRGSCRLYELFAA